MVGGHGVEVGDADAVGVGGQRDIGVVVVVVDNIAVGIARPGEGHRGDAGLCHHQSGGTCTGGGLTAGGVGDKGAAERTAVGYTVDFLIERIGDGEGAFIIIIADNPVELDGATGAHEDRLGVAATRVDGGAANHDAVLIDFDTSSIPSVAIAVAAVIAYVNVCRIICKAYIYR